MSEKLRKDLDYSLKKQKEMKDHFRKDPTQYKKQ